MSLLFDRDAKTIRKHINNVFKENEVDQDSNTQKMRVANSDKPVPFYSLDVIISVGYRVKSQNRIAFRKWATSILKDYMLKDYVRRDESMGVNYNVKYLFDVTQTSISNTFNCSYPTSNELELEFAFKHKEKDTETIYKNGNQQDYLIALLRHACRNSNPKDEFILESCVYSLASKYGLSMHTNITQKNPSYFAYRSPKEILKDIKELFDIISKCINHGLYVYKEEHINEQPSYW